MTSHEHAIQALEALRDLGDDWDGDDAPAPSEEAIERARRVIEALPRALNPEDVDADAVGGVALWFYEDDGRKTMLSIWNSGACTRCRYAKDGTLESVKSVKREIKSVLPDLMTKEEIETWLDLDAVGFYDPKETTHAD